MSTRSRAAAEAEAAAEEAEANPEPTEPTEQSTPQPSTSRLLTAGEGDDLTCEVCHTSIESGHGYLRAAYGPVHYTGCASKTVRR